MNRARYLIRSIYISFSTRFCLPFAGRYSVNSTNTSSIELTKWQKKHGSEHFITLDISTVDACQSVA